MSAQNGVWVIGATRSGIETNPLTHGQLYYNGGSSIWSPAGEKLAQAPVVAPEVLQPGLNGIYTATIDPAADDATREARLAWRRPELYSPLLAFHRCPTDSNATKTPRQAELVAVQWPAGPSHFDKVTVTAGALTVLPELSGLPSGLGADEIVSRAESQGGAFEQQLSQAAESGKGYLVGSYPERDGEVVYHTVVLAGPDGKILGRYRVTHPEATRNPWATPGDSVTVVDTALGRIGLAVAGELAVPELGGLYGALRTDILAAPAGLPSALQVQIDPKLFAVANPPTGRADYFPFASAKQNQLWLVSGGRQNASLTAAAIYGPEPVVNTPTLTAAPGSDSVRYTPTVPAPGTWINQAQLIAGQQALWFIPLTLAPGNSFLESWRKDSVSAYPLAQ
jgi:predicted amidohydrolase